MTNANNPSITQCIDHLLGQMLPEGNARPPWSSVLLVDDGSINWSTRTAPASALKTPEDFAAHFLSLVERRSWVKLAAEGIWKGQLVIVVSSAATLRQPSSAEIPNVVYSGLTIAVAGDSSWNIERSFRVVDP